MQSVNGKSYKKPIDWSQYDVNNSRSGASQILEIQNKITECLTGKSEIQAQINQTGFSETEEATDNGQEQTQVQEITNALNAAAESYNSAFQSVSSAAENASNAANNASNLAARAASISPTITVQVDTGEKDEQGKPIYKSEEQTNPDYQAAQEAAAAAQEEATSAQAQYEAAQANLQNIQATIEEMQATLASLNQQDTEGDETQNTETDTELQVLWEQIDNFNAQIDELNQKISQIKQEGTLPKTYEDENKKKIFEIDLEDGRKVKSYADSWGNNVYEIESQNGQIIRNYTNKNGLSVQEIIKEDGSVVQIIKDGEGSGYTVNSYDSRRQADSELNKLMAKYSASSDNAENNTETAEPEETLFDILTELLKAENTEEQLPEQTEKTEEDTTDISDFVGQFNTAVSQAITNGIPDDIAKDITENLLKEEIWKIKNDGGEITSPNDISIDPNTVVDRYNEYLRNNEPDKYALARTAFNDPENASNLLIARYGNADEAVRALQEGIDKLKTNSSLYADAKVSYDSEKGLLIETNEYGSLTLNEFIDQCKFWDFYNSDSAQRGNETAFIQAIVNNGFKLEPVTDKQTALETLTSANRVIAEDIRKGTALAQAIYSAKTKNDVYDAIYTYCGENKEVAQVVYDYIMDAAKQEQSKAESKGEKLPYTKEGVSDDYPNNPYEGRDTSDITGKLYTNIAEHYTLSSKLLDKFAETEEFGIDENGKPLTRPTKEYYTNLEGKIGTRNWEYTNENGYNIATITFEEDGSTRNIRFRTIQNEIGETFYIVSSNDDQDSAIVEDSDEFFKRLAVVQNYGIVGAAKSDSNPEILSTEDIKKYYEVLKGYDTNISKTLATIAKVFSSEGAPDKLRNQIVEFLGTATSDEDVLSEVAAETKHTLIMSYYLNNNETIAQALVRDELARRLSISGSIQETYEILSGYYGKDTAKEIIENIDLNTNNSFERQYNLFSQDVGQFGSAYKLMFDENDKVYVGVKTGDGYVPFCSYNDSAINAINYSNIKNLELDKIEDKYEDLKDHALTQEQAYKFLSTKGECTTENIERYDIAEENFTDYNTAIATGALLSKAKSFEDSFYLVTGKKIDDETLTDEDIQKFNDFYNIDNNSLKLYAPQEISLSSDPLTADYSAGEYQVSVQYDKENGFKIVYREKNGESKSVSVNDLKNMPSFIHDSIDPYSENGYIEQLVSNINSSGFVAKSEQQEFEKFYKLNKSDVDGYIKEYAKWAAQDEESIKHYKSRINGDVTPENIEKYITSSPRARFNESCKYMQYAYTSSKQALFGESRLDNVTSQYRIEMAQYSSKISHSLTMGCMVASVLFPAAAPVLMTGAKAAGYVDNAIGLLNMISNRQNYLDDDYIGWAESTGFEWITKRGYRYFSNVSSDAGEEFTKWFVDNTKCGSFFASHALAQIGLRGTSEALIETAICVPWTMGIKALQGGKYDLVNELKENFIYDFLPYARGWKDILSGGFATPIYEGNDKYYKINQSNEVVELDDNGRIKAIYDSYDEFHKEFGKAKTEYDYDDETGKITVTEYNDDKTVKTRSIHEDGGRKITYVDSEGKTLQTQISDQTEEGTRIRIYIGEADEGKTPLSTEIRDKKGRIVSIEQYGQKIEFDKSGEKSKLTINGSSVEVNYKSSLSGRTATVKMEDGEEYSYKIEADGSATIEIEGFKVCISEENILKALYGANTSNNTTPALINSMGYKLFVNSDGNIVAQIGEETVPTKNLIYLSDKEVRYYDDAGNLKVYNTQTRETEYPDTDTVDKGTRVTTENLSGITEGSAVESLKSKFGTDDSLEEDLKNLETKLGIEASAVFESLEQHSSELSKGDIKVIASNCANSPYYSPTEYIEQYLYFKNLESADGNKIFGDKTYGGIYGNAGVESDFIEKNIEYLMNIDPSSAKASEFQMLIEMCQNGEISSTALRVLTSDSELSPLLKEDLDTFCRVVAENTDKTQLFSELQEANVPTVEDEKTALGNMKAGSVFQVEGEEYIRIVTPDGTSKQLNITKDTYNKLFPLLDRCVANQMTLSNCYMLETFSLLYSDKATCADLLSKFSQDDEGNIYVQLNDSAEPTKFSVEDIQSGKYSDYSNGAKGFQLLQEAYIKIANGNLIQDVVDSFNKEQLENYNEFKKQNGNNVVFYYDSDFEIRYATREEVARMGIQQQYIIDNRTMGGNPMDVMKQLGYNSEFYKLSSYDAQSGTGKFTQFDLDNGKILSDNNLDIEKILTNALDNNSTVVVAISSHAYGLTRENGKYYLYNPYSQGLPEEFDSIEALKDKYMITSINIGNKDIQNIDGSGEAPYSPEEEDGLEKTGTEADGAEAEKPVQEVEVPATSEENAEKTYDSLADKRIDEIRKELGDEIADLIPPKNPNDINPIYDILDRIKDEDFSNVKELISLGVNPRYVIFAARSPKNIKKYLEYAENLKNNNIDDETISDFLNLVTNKGACNIPESICNMNSSQLQNIIRFDSAYEQYFSILEFVSDKNLEIISNMTPDELSKFEEIVKNIDSETSEFMLLSDKFGEILGNISKYQSQGVSLDDAINLICADLSPEKEQIVMECVEQEGVDIDLAIKLIQKLDSVEDLNAEQILAICKNYYKNDNYTVSSNLNLCVFAVKNGLDADILAQLVEDGKLNPSIFDQKKLPVNSQLYSQISSDIDKLCTAYMLDMQGKEGKFNFSSLEEADRAIKNGEVTLEDGTKVPLGEGNSIKVDGKIYTIDSEGQLREYQRISEENIFVPKFASESEVQKALSEGKLELTPEESIPIKAGDVIELEGHKNACIINKDGSITELNISKQTYLKLFPPVERFATIQNRIGNCFEISAFNEAYGNDLARGQVLKLFSEDENGNITITFPRSGRSYTFEDGKLPEDLDSDYFSRGALGNRLFEYADGMEMHNENAAFFRSCLEKNPSMIPYYAEKLHVLVEADSQDYDVYDKTTQKYYKFSDNTYFFKKNQKMYALNYDDYKEMEKKTSAEEGREAGRMFNSKYLQYRHGGYADEVFYRMGFGDCNSADCTAQNESFLRDPSLFLKNMVMLSTIPKGDKSETLMDETRGLYSRHANGLRPTKVIVDGKLEIDLSDMSLEDVCECYRDHDIQISAYAFNNPHNIVEAEMTYEELIKYGNYISWCAIPNNIPSNTYTEKPLENNTEKMAQPLQTGVEADTVETESERVSVDSDVDEVRYQELEKELQDLVANDSMYESLQKGTSEYDKTLSIMKKGIEATCAADIVTVLGDDNELIDRAIEYFSNATRTLDGYQYSLLAKIGLSNEDIELIDSTPKKYYETIAKLADKENGKEIIDATVSVLKTGFKGEFEDAYKVAERAGFNSDTISKASQLTDEIGSKYFDLEYAIDYVKYGKDYTVEEIKKACAFKKQNKTATFGLRYDEIIEATRENQEQFLRIIDFANENKLYLSKRQYCDITKYGLDTAQQAADSMKKFGIDFEEAMNYIRSITQAKPTTADEVYPKELSDDELKAKFESGTSWEKIAFDMYCQIRRCGDYAINYGEDNFSGDYGDLRRSINQRTPNIGIERNSIWTQRYMKGHQVDDPVDRISLNVKGNAELIEKLDSLMVESQGAFVYKAYSTPYQWGDREDPITLYFGDKVSDEMYAKIAEITEPYARGSINLSADSNTPWMKLEEYASGQKITDLLSKAKELNDGLYQALLKDSGGESLSSGQYEAYCKIIEEYEKYLGIGEREADGEDSTEQPDLSADKTPLTAEPAKTVNQDELIIDITDSAIKELFDNLEQGEKVDLGEGISVQCCKNGGKLILESEDGKIIKANYIDENGEVKAIDFSNIPENAKLDYTQDGVILREYDDMGNITGVKYVSENGDFGEIDIDSLVQKRIENYKKELSELVGSEEYPKHPLSDEEILKATRLSSEFYVEYLKHEKEMSDMVSDTFKDIESIEDLSSRAKSENSTYTKLIKFLQSGNVSIDDTQKCKEVIADAFGTRIQVANLTEEQRREAVNGYFKKFKMDCTYEDYLKVLNGTADEETLRQIDSVRQREILQVLKEKHTDLVVNRLVEGIRSKKITIADGKISNYGNEESTYFTPKQLERIADAYFEATGGKKLKIISMKEDGYSDKIIWMAQMTEDGSYYLGEAEKFTVESKSAQKDSGYATGQFKVVYNFSDGTTGYGEIQIRGTEVNKFGDVEHIPYDLKSKKLDGNDPKYANMYMCLASMDDESYARYNKIMAKTYEAEHKIELGFPNVEIPQLTGEFRDKNGNIIDISCLSYDNLMRLSTHK